MNVRFKFENNKIIQTINDELKSVYFIAFYALITLLSSVFSWELAYYTVSLIIAVFILIFCKDISPIITVTAFIYFSPSVGNNPGRNPDSIYYPENGLIYIIILIVLFLAVFFIRIISDVLNDREKLGLPKLTFGFVALGTAYFLGGIGYEEYTFETLLFALLQIASLSLLYFLFVCVLDWKEIKKDYFGWICLFGCAIIFYQILYAYAYGDVIVDGKFYRSAIYTGWGMYNNAGVAMDMFLPGIFYLAVKKKHGWIFSVIGLIMFGGVIMTNSRTSIAVGCVLYILCSVLVMAKSKGKNRILNGAVFILSYIAIAVIVLKFSDKVEELISALLNFQDDGSSRIEIWKNGIELFKEHKIFGTGFYSCELFKWGDSDSFIPPRWHNTYVQLLASCGIVGIAAYLFHRVQTIILLFKRPSFEKTMIALCVVALISTSFLDCHFFNIGPGLIYSLLLAFAEKSDESVAE